MIAENQGSTVQKRYVFGPGTDEPIVQYDAAGNRSWMTADERGSIVAFADDSGTATAIDTYDEYGKPGATNSGRFQYTGQMWLPEAALYHYKARDYLPQLGVFAEPDPIGQDGGPNLYAYVGGDPVNAIDPTGLDVWCGGVWATVCAPRINQPDRPGFENREILLSPGERNGGDRRTERQQRERPKPAYCSSLAYQAAQKAQQFGEGLSNFAGGVIGAGLFAKVPPVVGAGETVGAFGLVFQSLGALGKYSVSGNTSVAALDAAGVVSSFFKTQTKAAQLASGYAMGAAIGTAQEVGHMNPCG